VEDLAHRSAIPATDTAEDLRIRVKAVGDLRIDERHTGDEA